MHITILIPHFRTGKMTAYTISQLLKFKGAHELDILVIDNNAGDGSTEYLIPFMKDIAIIEYPKDKMQSHGIAFDYVIPHIRTEWFITLESDSYPTKEGWLNYYKNIIDGQYDGAGSLLNLSGGQYMHPAGALYKKSIWQEAKDYCDSIDYAYLPNIAMKDGFPCHLMVNNNFFGEFCKHPGWYVDLHYSYNNHTPLMIAEKALAYEPVTKPFHSGLGRFNESYNTYGQRNIESEPPGIILTNEITLIKRMGYEPGQWLHYFMLATGKKLFYIPTETIWMPNRVNQQQEYTINEVGFKHLWGISAYDGCAAENVQDIVKFKAKQVEELYQSIKIPGQTEDITN